LSFIQLTSLSVLLFALFVSDLALAQTLVFKCIGAGGEKVFQDFPCGLGQNAAQQTQAERNRWTMQSGTCRVHSPYAPFAVQVGEATYELQGGARLELLAAESGIAANVVLNAAWPREPTTAPTGSERLEPLPSTVSENSAKLADAGLQSRTGAQLLELSGDISGHAIIVADGQRFAVDSMLDPRRMAFGYGQTAVMLKTLRSTEFFKFQLLLRAPSVAINSGELPSAGLRDALVALSGCVKARQARGSNSGLRR
jgi:hypothetical protein